MNFWFESEPANAGRPMLWRGSVEHIASGRRFYFSEVASLVNFLMEWLGRRDDKDR